MVWRVLLGSAYLDTWTLELRRYAYHSVKNVLLTNAHRIFADWFYDGIIVDAKAKNQSVYYAHLSNAGMICFEGLHRFNSGNIRSYLAQ